MAQDDAANQLQVQQQINKVLQQRSAMLSNQATQISAQVQLAAELCSALDCEDLEGLKDRLGSINDTLSQASDKASNTGQNLRNAFNSGSKQSKKLGTAIKKDLEGGFRASHAAAIGFIAGLIKGFKSVLNIIKSVSSGVKRIGSSILGLGKSILAVPFKLMSGLIGMAQEGGGGGPNPIKVALEEIRGEFGSLASNEGKAVAGQLDVIRGSMKDLAGTGLSVRHVYGRGREGVANALKDINELAKAAGPSLNKLMDTFKESGVALAMYTKGLTGSADATMAIVKHFEAMGKGQGVKAMDAIASQAVLMGKQFGVSAKVIGKSIGEMMKDVSNFGHLAPKELAATATFASKLGIEIKDLGAVTDKFLNFEDAAQGAAQLQQAFGMTVDTMEMMKGGAAAIDELRKGFFAAGKSVKDLTLQERKLLEQQTGLTGAALDAAFAADKQGLSYDELSDAAEDNEKKQLTQAEAMKELADSIQKTFGGGGGGTTFKGFFDAFIQGFAKGIKRSKPFMKLMRNIRKSLRVVFRAGKDIGKMFVEMFPGVKQMIGGMAELFNPKHFTKLMTKVKAIFKQFFKDLSGPDPEQGVKGFIQRMKDAFASFFGDRAGGAKQVSEGFKKFAKAFKAIFKVLGHMALTGIRNAVSRMAEAIRNPPEEVKKGGSAFKKLLQTVGTAILDMFKALWSKYGSKLADAFKNLFTALIEKAKPIVKELGQKALKAIFAYMLFQGLIGSLRSGLIFTAVAGIFKGIGGMFKKAASGAPGKDAGKQVSRGFGGFAMGFREFIEEVAKLDYGKMLSATVKLAFMAAVLLPILAGAFGLGLTLVFSVLQRFDAKKLAVSLVAVGAMVLVLGTLVKMLDRIDSGQVFKASAALLAMSIMLPTAGLAFILGSQIVGRQLMRADFKAMAVGLLGMMAMILVLVPVMAAASLLGKVDAMSALKGLVMGTIFMAALAGIGLVITPLAPLLGFISAAMPQILPGLVGMAIIMGAISLAAIAVAAAGPAFLPALGFMVPLALFTGGMTLFAVALSAIAPFFAKLPMGDLALGFLSMAAIFVAIGVIAAIAAVSGLAAIAGLLGLIPIAYFVDELASTDGFMGTLVTFSKINESLGKEKILNLAKSFGALAVIFPAIALIAGVTAFAGILAAAAWVFFGPVVAFISEIPKLAEPLDAISKEKGLTKAQTLKPTFEGLALLFDVVKSAAAAAMKIDFFTPPNTKMLGAFIGDIADHLGEPIKKMVKMPMVDGPKVKGIMEAITPVLDAMGGLSGAAVALAKLDTKSMKKGKESGGTLEAASGFISTLTKGMGAVVKAVTDMLTTVTPEQLQSARQLSPLLKSVATMMQAVQPPPELFKAMQVVEKEDTFFGSDTTTKTNVDAIAPMLEGTQKFVATMMDTLASQIPAMVTAVEQAAKKLPDDLNKFTKELAMIMKVMDVVSSVADMVGGMSESMAKLSEVSVMGAKVKSNAVGMSMFAEMITSIAKGVQEALPTMIDGVVQAANKITDPGDFSAKAELIGKALDIVGKMVNVMSSVKGTGGGLMSKALGKAEEMAGSDKVSKFAADMTTIVNSLKIEIPNLVNAILGIEIPGDPEKAAGKIDIISKAMKIVTTFSKVMGDMTKLGTSKIAGETTVDIAGMLEGVNQIVENLAGGKGKSGSIATLVMKILKLGQKVKNPKEAETQMGIIASALEIVSKFAGTMKTIMSLVPEVDGQTITSRIDALTNETNGVIPSIVDSLVGEKGGITTIFTKLSGLNTEGIDKDKISKIGDLFGIIGVFTDALSKVQGLAKPQGDAGQMGDVIGTVSDIVTAIVGDGGIESLVKGLVDVVTGQEENLKMIGKKRASIRRLGTVFETVGKFADALGSLSGLATPDSSIGTVIRQLAFQFETADIAGLVTSLKTAFDFDTKELPFTNTKKLNRFLEKNLLPLTESLDAMPTNMGEQLKAIEQGFVDLGMGLEVGDSAVQNAVKVSNAVAKGGKVEVTGIPDKITLNIDVKLDAKQLASGLAKPLKVEHKFQTGT